MKIGCSSQSFVQTKGSRPNFDLANFDSGPRELTGSVDLINYYKLHLHHDFFCKRSLPSSISDTHYLHSVVGETEIRKGDGMELDQLFHNPMHFRDRIARIQPFDLDILKEAFQLRESSPVELPLVRVLESKEKTSSFLGNAFDPM